MAPEFGIGGFAPGEAVSLDYLLPVEEGETAAHKPLNSLKYVMTIGRDKDNKIVLPAQRSPVFTLKWKRLATLQGA